LYGALVKTKNYMALSTQQENILFFYFLFSSQLILIYSFSLKFISNLFGSNFQFILTKISMKSKVILFIVLFAIVLIMEAQGKAKRCFEVNPVTGSCPLCENQPYSTNENCTCATGFDKSLRKYACGPACDAIGYCCSKP
jgi:hypothetical protein